MTEELRQRIVREQEARERAREAFRRREERRRRWMPLRAAACVLLFPVVLVYVAARLAWEVRK